MTWTLSKITIGPNPNPALQRLLKRVEMVFDNLDGNGATLGQHTYIEPNVSDVSDAAIARLCRDQMRQLEVISATSDGPMDIVAIAALVNQLPPPPAVIDPADQAEADKRAAITIAITTHRKLQALVADGVLASSDADVDAAKKAYQDLVNDDRTAVLDVLAQFR